MKTPVAGQNPIASRVSRPATFPPAGGGQRAFRLRRALFRLATITTIFVVKPGRGACPGSEATPPAILQSELPVGRQDVTAAKGTETPKGRLSVEVTYHSIVTGDDHGWLIAANADGGINCNANGYTRATALCPAKALEGYAVLLSPPLGKGTTKIELPADLRRLVHCLYTGDLPGGDQYVHNCVELKY